MKGVGRVTADQCQFGQENIQKDPVRKPTGFMSNAPELLKTLAVRCMGRGGACSRRRGGNHAQCLGSTARRAAIFQDELCVAILQGMRRQLIADGDMKENEVGFSMHSDGVDEVRQHLVEKKECPEEALRPPFEGALGSTNEEAMNEKALKFTSQGDRFMDDLTGLPLPAELCQAARAKEID